ncbi:ABC transporter [Arcanobacterium hippocoleae]|uniref:ABC transporter n=1 Tax=Arcanobacterium hippocoleae TaxID=149017 RepID=UPI003340E5F4
MNRSLTTKIFSLELKRTFRAPEFLFYTIALPSVMYLIFGALANYGKLPVGDTETNWSFIIMANIAAYGAILATTSVAADAAVEWIQGWGRQIALTPLKSSSFIKMKVSLGAAISLLPITAIFIIGASTTAQAELKDWFMTALVLFIGAFSFGFYGIAASLIFRSQNAVSIATGLTTLFAFGGNLFTPLEGFYLIWQGFSQDTDMVYVCGTWQVKVPKSR